MKYIPAKANYDPAKTLDAPTEWNPLAEDLQNFITDTGQTVLVGTTDVNQFSRAASANAAVATFYTCGNVGNAYTLTPIDDFKSPPAYIDGMEIRFRPSAANSGASTINVNSLGIKNIKKEDGATDIDAGQLVTTQDAYLRYDLGNDCFLFLTFSSSGGGGTGDTQAGVDTFVNGDLVTGVYTWNHAVGTQDVLGVTVKDNNNNIIIPDNIEIVDNNNIDIDVSSYGTITGTWTVSGGFKV